MTLAGEAEFVHASALVVGEAGLLVRGPSGSGKTGLALRLLDEGRRDGRFTALVADDRVALSVRGGRLLARPHPAIAGLAERRGYGVVPVDHEPACVVRLVIDLVPAEAAERLPGPAGLRTVIAGIVLPRLALPTPWTALDAGGLILSHPALGKPGVRLTSI